MTVGHMQVVSKRHGTFNVTMCPDDLELYGKHKWTAKVETDGRVYFRRHIRLQDGVWVGVYLHRLIANAPDGLEVDHIHHVYTDLRRSQLRVSTHKKNTQNRRKTEGETSSRFKGVSIDSQKGKWRSHIYYEGKTISLGRFPKTKTGEVDAAKAYDTKARELFGEFAHTNFAPEVL